MMEEDRDAGGEEEKEWDERRKQRERGKKTLTWLNSIKSLE